MVVQIYFVWVLLFGTIVAAAAAATQNLTVRMYSADAISPMHFICSRSYCPASVYGYVRLRLRMRLSVNTPLYMQNLRTYLAQKTSHSICPYWTGILRPTCRFRSPGIGQSGFFRSPKLVDRAQEIKTLQDDRSFDALKQVEFLFFSRANGGKPVKLTFDRTEMLPSYGFKKDLPTKILVHGWVGDSESEVIGPLAKEYLKKGDVNVIGVNWTKGAKTIYGFARKRVGAVGDLVAKLVSRLLDLGQVVDQIGMIGHSLGAHVVGLAGKKTPKKVAYIVGLDPAQPYFLVSKPQGRLADTDAQYVEVVHTNGNWLAIFTNIGTADFYPNGGKKQPGCGLLFYRRCSHKRAVTLFKESLMAKGYFANRCPSLDKLNRKCSLGRVEFGEVAVHPLMKKPRGVYYFETNAAPPFLKTSPKVLQDTPQEATSEQESP